MTKSYKYYLFFVITYCYAVIYTGAYVKHTEATLACAGFPLCNGQIFPGLSGPIGAHYFHRVAGTVLFIFLLILMIWTIRSFKQERVLIWTSVLAFVLVLLQIISGVSVVFTQNALSVGLMHAIIISILFTTLTYMVMIVLRKSK